MSNVNSYSVDLQAYLEPCAVNLWAPQTFGDRRATAIDNLLMHCRCHVGVSSYFVAFIDNQKRSPENFEDRTKFVWEYLKNFLARPRRDFFGPQPKLTGVPPLTQ